MLINRVGYLERGTVLEYFGHKFKLIDQLFKARANKSLENIDVTFAQLQVLVYLEHHEHEKVTQKKLTEEFKVKHSTMAGILQRMSEKELILISVDEENKKFKNIVRTEKAEKIRQLMDENRLKTEGILLKGFSEEEKDTLSYLLDKVYDNLRNDSDLTHK